MAPAHVLPASPSQRPSPSQSSPAPAAAPRGLGVPAPPCWTLREGGNPAAPRRGPNPRGGDIPARRPQGQARLQPGREIMGLGGTDAALVGHRARGGRASCGRRSGESSGMPQGSGAGHAAHAWRSPCSRAGLPTAAWEARGHEIRGGKVLPGPPPGTEGWPRAAAPDPVPVPALPAGTAGRSCAIVQRQQRGQRGSGEG